jgi:4-amino-4-deoxy-L-arabinose transferase-like glycosyltransferase
MRIRTEYKIRASGRIAVQLLVVCGTCGLLVLLVSSITGGFVVNVGPMRVSVHRWQGPLAVAVLAWLGLAAQGRRRLSEAAASVSTFLDRRALTLAALVSCAAAGAGIAFGTYSASGADAAGYVSQARLLADARLTDDEPLARAVAWPEATWSFSPLGYRPGSRPGELAPTYPSGLPALMAAAQMVGGEWAPFVVVPLLGAAAVFCTYLIGATLSSPTAGFTAAVLLATSPIFLFQLVQPMSDVPATALWTLALLLALMPQPGAAVAGGITAGLAVLTRPNLVLLLPAVAAAGFVAALPGSRRRRTFGLFALGFAPFPVVLLFLNWHIHGSPFATGYGSPGELFGLSNIWPNMRAYAWRLLRGEGPALALALLSLGVILFRHPRSPISGQPHVAPLARLAVIVFSTLLVCYLPYGVFAEWSYLRFLLPGFPMLLVLVAALLVTASTAVPAAARGLVVLVALAIAGSINVTHARREQAFNLHRYEARYRDVGRYLAAALPRNAVVVAAQESASSRYYARAPVVRWDLLGLELDAAVAQLRALGLIPLLLVEDWEARDLRARFPASDLARLDWPPRADIGTSTRVRLYDPSDRGRSRAALTTDRLP